MVRVNPTREQAGALRRFATDYRHGGRRWKAALRHSWEHGYYYYLSVSFEDSALLHGIRNQFGPSWLARVTLADLRRWEVA